MSVAHPLPFDKIGAEQVPYFRTSEFSDVMFENERLIKKFAKASDDSKVVFLTSSGSGHADHWTHRRQLQLRSFCHFAELDLSTRPKAHRCD